MSCINAGVVEEHAVKKYQEYRPLRPPADGDMSYLHALDFLVRSANAQVAADRSKK